MASPAPPHLIAPAPRRTPPPSPPPSSAAHHHPTPAGLTPPPPPLDCSVNAASVPSLQRLAVAALIAHRHLLSDLGFAPPELLADALARLSPRQLAAVEDATAAGVAGPRTDLPWHTWHLWQRHYYQEFGAPPRDHPPPAPLEGEPPYGYREPAVPAGAASGARAWRGAYEQRAREVTARAAAAGAALRAQYAKAREERAARSAQLTRVVMVAGGRRGGRARGGGGMAGRLVAPAGRGGRVGGPAPPPTSSSSSGGRRAEVLRGLGLSPVGAGVAKRRLAASPSPAPPSGVGAVRRGGGGSVGMSPSPSPLGGRR